MSFASPSYGRCPCGGVYERRKVEIRLSVGDEPVVLENAEQGACPVCGSRVYKAQVIEELETLMGERSHRPFESPA